MTTIEELKAALKNMMDHSHMLAHLHRSKKLATKDVIDFAETDWKAAKELLARPVGECGGWQSLGLTEAEEALANALDKEPNEQPD